MSCRSCQNGDKTIALPSIIAYFQQVTVYFRPSYLKEKKKNRVNVYEVSRYLLKPSRCEKKRMHCENFQKHLYKSYKYKTDVSAVVYGDTLAGHHH